MSLFQHGEFRLHSGGVSDYKIDCDALTAADWQALAGIIRVRLPAFGAVYGVPCGGAALQTALDPFATGHPRDGLLICDDVYTTGRSLSEARERLKERWPGPISGVVVFARGPIAELWVSALLTVSLP